MCCLLSLGSVVASASLSSSYSKLVTSETKLGGAEKGPCGYIAFIVKRDEREEDLPCTVPCS